MTKKHIILVEDDFRLAQLIQDHLQSENRDVFIISDGHQAITDIISQHQDLLI